MESDVPLVKNDSITIKVPTYNCPVHGETENVMSVSLPQFREGVQYYCMICMVEKLEELGVTPICKL